jgi:starch phosphorylase
MNDSTNSSLPSETQAWDALTRLALDLSWSWSHSADEIWKRLDPELWELTANPWLILQSMSPRKLGALKLDFQTDAAFRERIEQLLTKLGEKNAAPAWFQTAHPSSPVRTIAYFSMEYMLSEALPIYSGGLGNVAGDQLKAASDLGVPVVAIGLLYQQGYFRQELDAQGDQQVLYPVNEPGQLPLRRVRTSDGELLRMALSLPGGKVWIRTWEVQVGRTRLYLLDTNDPANPPSVRALTSELYGGGSELRLKQEMLLGIGGWRFLRELRIPANVCHLNEGHAAFAVLERAHEYMEEAGRPFHEALAITRAGNIFTTHTAVEAGFDRFSPELIQQYLSGYARDILGISVHDLLSLGRKNPDDTSEPFNMAYLGIHGSGSVNGVSRLHGQVSRRLFQQLFPRFPENEVPVGHVTNGIHVPTWDGADADRLWTELCGKDRWLGDLNSLQSAVRRADDQQIWNTRCSQRTAFVNYTRQRLSRQQAGYGASLLQVQQAEAVLNPQTLTLGFARRFATYKRATLLLHDRERLARILTNPQRPVQLVLAGKAHPADQPGQALIREWTSFARQPEIRPHVVFLSDYDMALAQRMVEGVDVWINTPKRPWEASGTSGMKVLVNGGLNLSILDGWWAEAYTPEVGWAIGDGEEHGDDPAWDRADAEALYEVLENEIIPEFYERDEQGIPRGWVAKIRESMAALTPEFSANRTVRQYTEEHYIPAATAYARRACAGSELTTAFLTWQEQIARHWDDVHFGALTVTEQNGELIFEAELDLGGLDPGSVRVELYAGLQDGKPAFRQEMHPTAVPGSCTAPGLGSGTYLYAAQTPATRAAGDFTPRVLPYHELALPTEIRRIIWQK